MAKITVTKMKDEIFSMSSEIVEFFRLADKYDVAQDKEAVKKYRVFSQIKNMLPKETSNIVEIYNKRFTKNGKRVKDFYSGRPKEDISSLYSYVKEVYVSINSALNKSGDQIKYLFDGDNSLGEALRLNYKKEGLETLEGLKSKLGDCLSDKLNLEGKASDIYDLANEAGDFLIAQIKDKEVLGSLMAGEVYNDSKSDEKKERKLSKEYLIRSRGLYKSLNKIESELIRGLGAKAGKVEEDIYEFYANYIVSDFYNKCNKKGDVNTLRFTDREISILIKAKENNSNLPFIKESVDELKGYLSENGGSQDKIITFQNNLFNYINEGENRKTLDQHLQESVDKVSNNGDILSYLVSNNKKVIDFYKSKTSKVVLGITAVTLLGVMTFGFLPNYFGMPNPNFLQALKNTFLVGGIVNAGISMGAIALPSIIGGTLHHFLVDKPRKEFGKRLGSEIEKSMSLILDMAKKPVKTKDNEIMIAGAQIREAFKNKDMKFIDNYILSNKEDFKSVLYKKDAEVSQKRLLKDSKKLLKVIIEAADSDASLGLNNPFQNYMFNRAKTKVDHISKNDNLDIVLKYIKEIPVSKDNFYLANVSEQLGEIFHGAKLGSDSEELIFNYKPSCTTPEFLVEDLKKPSEEIPDVKEDQVTEVKEVEANKSVPTTPVVEATTTPIDVVPESQENIAVQEVIDYTKKVIKGKFNELKKEIKYGSSMYLISLNAEKVKGKVEDTCQNLDEFTESISEGLSELTEFKSTLYSKKDGKVVTVSVTKKK